MIVKSINEKLLVNEYSVKVLVDMPVKRVFSNSMDAEMFKNIGELLETKLIDMAGTSFDEMVKIEITDLRTGNTNICDYALISNDEIKEDIVVYAVVNNEGINIIAVNSAIEKFTSSFMGLKDIIL
ncbi:hypothetical protein K9O30_01685 [Clostridium bowmanii]|uniref:hypothetical protein n=1 Tax=Clostridium bowmanii TaxID=132925 RepID=UPI001C0BA9CD|nr:hypothetical protein [Clostridium bowmanii]MBU3190319.1 hypothetical protein [Clostridium bowmanii]MCA1072469.1 hypothetical protein [Clostridium bowmanii]